MAERHFSAGHCVVEIDGLFTLFVRIGVVENPLVAGQVCAMAVFGHNIFAYNLNFFCAVFIEVKGVFVRGMPGPGEDVARVAPDKV